MVPRTLFLGLAAVAGLCLVGAVAVVAIAPDDTDLWLAVLLLVLAVVVVAELVLLLVDRRSRATREEPSAR